MRCSSATQGKKKVLAVQFVDYLKQSGLGVWWDQNISPCSNDFRDEIFKEINNSRCALQIWTPNINEECSSWLNKEAENTIQNSKLVLICVDGGRPTAQFLQRRQCNEISLEDGKVRRSDLKNVLELIREVIGIRGKKNLSYNQDTTMKKSKEMILHSRAPYQALTFSFHFAPVTNPAYFC